MIKKGMKWLGIVLMSMGMGLVTGCDRDTLDIPALTFDVTPETVVMVEGQTTTLNVSWEPIEEVTAVTWKSSQTSVATVADNGEVTAVSVGDTTITVTDDDDSRNTDTARISVVVPTITVTPADQTLLAGKTLTLTATSEPDVIETFTWSVSNGSVATITQAGILTGVSAGTVLVRAESSDRSEWFGTTNVTVIDAPVVTIDQGDSLTIPLDETSQLSFTVRPEGILDDFTWRSADTDIATIASTGLISPVQVGQVQLTVSSASNPSVSDTLLLTVTAAPALSVSTENLTLTVEETHTVTATDNPDGSIPNVVWTTTDSDIATVSQDGLITAVSAGTVTVRVSDQTNSTRFKDVAVTVSPKTSFVLSHETLTLNPGDVQVVTLTIAPPGRSASPVWSNTNATISTLSVAENKMSVTIVGLTLGDNTVVVQDASDATLRATVNITVEPEADRAVQAPTLSGEVEDGHVVLTWVPVEGPGSFTYDIYRRTDSLSGFSLLDSDISGTTYTDESSEPGVGYDYVVKEKNGSGQVSEASNSVILIVPSTVITPVGFWDFDGDFSNTVSSGEAWTAENLTFTADGVESDGVYQVDQMQVNVPSLDTGTFTISMRVKVEGNSIPVEVTDGKVLNLNPIIVFGNSFRWLMLTQEENDSNLVLLYSVKDVENDRVATGLVRMSQNVFETISVSVNTAKRQFIFQSGSDTDLYLLPEVFEFDVNNDKTLSITHFGRGQVFRGVYDWVDLRNGVVDFNSLGLDPNGL